MHCNAFFSIFWVILSSSFWNERCVNIVEQPDYQLRYTTHTKVRCMTRMDAASELNCLFCCYFVLFLFALHSVDCFVCDINFHHNWMYVKRPTNRVTQMNRCARSTPLPVQEKNNDINNKNKWLPLLLTLRCLCKHISFFVANNFYESLRARARECMCTDFSLFVAHFSPSLGHGLHLRCQLAQWNFKWMCFSWTVFSEWRRTYKFCTTKYTHMKLLCA